MAARILLVFAHPDDESFVAGGLARRYADAGATIALISATHGEAGAAGDPPLCSREELPACREGELRQAASILGIAPVHLLGYSDRHLAEAQPQRIREELVGLIRHHRPHLVITFDPNGGHGHADHIAIARFTMDAVAAAADARWHRALGAAHSVQRTLWTPPILAWDVSQPPNTRDEPGIDFLVDVSAYRQTKASALRAHRTQHRSTDRWFFSRPDVDQLLSVETFRQAWGPPLQRIPDDDVLAGIDH